MASKKIKVQGSRFFAFDGEKITRMGCLKTFDPGSGSTTKIDDTCLDEPDTKSSTPGLEDPGDGSLGFDIDVKNPSHLEIVEWATAKKTMTIIVGSPGLDTEVPTVETGALILPKTRTWWVFDATLTTPVWKFEPDTLVNCTITMQRKTKTDFKPETV